MDNLNNVPNRCLNCSVYHEAISSDNPAVCIWYLEKHVIAGVSVARCTEYSPYRKEVDNNG